MPKPDKPPLAGTAAPNAWGFYKQNGEALKGQDCIFPILKKTTDGEYRLIGTGFYICAQGVFVTATHVLKEVLDPVTGTQKEPIGVFHLNAGGGYTIRPILRAWHSPTADVSVGVAAPAIHNTTREPLISQSATLTLRQPAIGEQVVTYAYPDFTRVQNGKVQELYFSPRFYDGHVEEFYPTGRDRVLMPWPCYRTSIHLHGGSSGGPVLDKFGRVFGVNCRSMDPQTDVSFITPISHIMNGFVDDVNFADDLEPRRVMLSQLISMGHIAVRS